MATGFRMFVALTVGLVLPAAIGLLWDNSRATNNPNDAIVQLENKWLQAEDNADALNSILANDFVHVLPNGFVTKEEQLRNLHNHPRTNEETKYFEGLRVRIYGDVAVVNGTVVANGENGKIRKTLFTDVFACRKERWQAVNAQETPLADPPGQ